MPDGLVENDRFAALADPLDPVTGAMAALVLSNTRKNVIYHLSQTQRQVPRCRGVIPSS